ncbi:MAG: TRAP transporter substrate-binding protein [Lachnospiraceae bacterium]|nr:TRAP transporter substrate-binding protein [Lachnospiraceae bacterium]
MRMKKFLAAVLVAAMGATMLFGCGGKDGGSTTAAPGGSEAADGSEAAGDNGDTITFKMSLNDPETSNYYKGACAIADEVEKATNGRIKIEVYAGGSLGGERDCVELAMNNDLDIATTANSVLTNFIPEMGIIDQAYLWTSIDQAHAAVDGDLGAMISEKAEGIGLHVIGWMESGFRDTFSTKPIASVADFKGIKIRTMQNDFHMAAFNAFGAIATPMAYGEVFTALQQGTIDACENAISNCLASGFYEVTKNVTNTKHAYVYILVCMSDDAWNKVPEDLRDTFLEAVKKGYEAQRQYLVDANTEATEELKKLGVEFFDIDVNELQSLYQDAAEEEGWTFDEEWQKAVDKAISENP